MSKRREQERRAKKRMQTAAEGIVKKLTPEQQDRLVELLAKAVTSDVADTDTLRTETTGK
jgi:Spy/CpxP family protein refolding chaperone